MVKYIDQVEIKHKKVLLRVDFNVSINETLKITDDLRIRQSLLTIEHLLQNGNKIIIATHLGRPKKRDSEHSLRIVKKRLQEYLPKYNVVFVEDFLAPKGKKQLLDQKNDEVILLENIRFYEGEKQNDPEFSKQLSEVADVFVNDAFGVSHRKSASVVGITKWLPSYGGLLLKHEIEMIGGLLKHPKKPFLAIIGGSKVSTKFSLLHKLTQISDVMVLGGGIANTFLAAKGFPVGKSLYEKGISKEVEKIIREAKRHGTEIILPQDVAVGDMNNDDNGGEIRKVEDVRAQDVILDMGPETLASYGQVIVEAKTIVWNGPIGYIENEQFRQGTDFLYYSIVQNKDATSIVGGGDTIAAISKKEYLDKISHISTGGGAMLEFIENGTLPGIEALE